MNYNYNKNLTLEAKGLLSYMLSKPKNFDFSIDIIRRDNPKIGIDRLRKTIKILEKTSILIEKGK